MTVPPMPLIGSQPWLWPRLRVGVTLGVLWIVAGVPAARADDLLVVRCVDVEAPDTWSTTGQPLTWSKMPGTLSTFDITISPSRRQGWYGGGLVSTGIFTVDQEHPAILALNPAYYRLDAPRTIDGDHYDQWLYLDRVAGTVDLYAAREGQASGHMARGGSCARLVPKF